MGILDLWLPILVSAAACWVMSAIIWTLLKHHTSDYRQTADEEAVRAALKGNTPGFYLLPYCTNPGDLKDPEIKKKYEDGPLAYITMLPNGIPGMGGRLVGQFLFFILVGGFNLLDYSIAAAMFIYAFLSFGLINGNNSSGMKRRRVFSQCGRMRRSVRIEKDSD